ncbi:hypothetical protein [Neobacillus bataviensis]|uniref:hypothetical protein n=1 Tax=Neobacillus bataviensis TaxID=220685 RepID=UPI001CBAAD8C|nr:hypothetical protein [Neobacillus bataviensis]
MDAIAWLRISIVGYSLGGVLLIVSIFMFLKMNIPAIIGDLTGRTAARKIQEIREQNTGNKRHTPKAFALEQEPKQKGLRTNRLGTKGKTGRTGPTKELSRPARMGSLPTEVLPNKDDETVLLSDQTELLSMETEVLLNETVLLDQGTELLDETTVLDETVVLGVEEEAILAVEFKIVKDLKVIHTNEVI